MMMAKASVINGTADRSNASREVKYVFRMFFTANTEMPPPCGKGPT